jgi:hypothetical protein
MEIARMAVDTSWLGFWEELSEWGSGAVFLGIILEGPELLEKFNRLPKWISKKGAARIELIGWMLVAGGICVEILGTHFAQSILHLTNAELYSEARQSELETQRIKEKIAWRSLTQDEVTKFRNSVLNIRKGSIIVVSNGGDAEAANFAWQVAQMLAGSGFEVRSNIAGVLDLSSFNFGVSIDVDNPASPPDFAWALAKALTDSGIAINPGLVGKNFDGGEVSVFVGAKPLQLDNGPVITPPE